MKKVSGWLIVVAVIAAAIAVISVVFSQYEIGYDKERWLYLRPARIVTGTQTTFSDEAFHELVSRELAADQPYYTQHETTYTIISLDEQQGIVHLGIEERGSVRNPGSEIYEPAMQIVTDKSLDEPWAKVDGNPLTPQVSRQGAHLVADFAKVSVSPGASRHLERGFKTHYWFPFYWPDLLAMPTLMNSVTIKLKKDLAQSLTISVVPIFENSNFEGPKVSTHYEYEHYDWWSRNTALFPYQGFFIIIRKK